MKTNLRTLTPEESTAIQAAAWMYGKNFKSAIYRAWNSGNYSRECLSGYSGTLQRMRNSADGHDLLESLRAKDFVATPSVAFIMGKNACLNGGQNPFGVASLAAAWRKGYTVTRENALMSTPRSVPSI